MIAWKLKKKGLNDRVQIVGNFNVGITCNADLNIRLQGDLGAWRRRLLLIKYERPAPKKKIPDFANQLMREEGPGILRWMVQGAAALLEDLENRGDYQLTQTQGNRIDTLLDQSDSVRLFVENRIVRVVGDSASVSELMLAYFDYCEERGWHPYSTGDFHKALPNHMLAIHRANKAHSVVRDGKQVRGFNNVLLLQGGNE